METNATTGTEVDAVECTDGEELGNNTPATAHDLGSVPESADLRTVTGLLSATGDADWYQFTGLVINGFDRPRAEIDGFEDLRVCVFVQCADETAPTLESCNSPETEGDFVGCCGVRQTNVNYTCSSEGDVQVLIRVDGGEPCQTYDLEYRF